MSRLLKPAAFALSGALAALIFCCLLVAGMADDAARVRADAYSQGYEDAKEDSQPLFDRPIPEGNHMPLWLQTDPQWDYIPYANGTIGDSGCGLVAAAMAIKYMTLQEVTPLQLADSVGDSCLTDGVNDPGKFCEWIATRYPEYNIERSQISYDLDGALAAVEDGWLCFAGMSGDFGDSSYGGHVVLIWRADDDGYWVRDPDSAGNSARSFTADELAAVDFKYFYTIRGGFYGA